MADSNYWSDRYWPRMMKQRLSRRRLIQLSALGAAGAAGAAYLGCGGEDKKDGSTPSAGKTVAPVGTPTRGGTFTMPLGAAFSTMDPAYFSLNGDKFIYNIYDAPQTGDLDQDKNMILVPVLAESWEVIDGWHFTMHWRKDVKFQDGTDFNSAAIKYHFDRIGNPANRSSHLATLKQFDRLENSDDYTTTIYVAKENSTLLNALNYWMTSIPSPTAVEKWGNDYQSHPVGSGPFMLKRQEPGALYEFERNPNYWRKDEPYLDGFKIRIIPDKAVAAGALKAGEIEYAEQGELDVSDIATFQKDDNFEVVVAGASWLGTIFINKKREPGNNIHLRKAISYAINREEFIAKYNGLAYITPGPLPKQSSYANPDEPDPVYDPEKAKEELKLAGYEDGLTIKVAAMNDANSISDMELLQAQLASVGIRAEAEFVAVTVVGLRISQADYDFAFGPWPCANPGDIEYAQAMVYASTGFFNNGATSDPEIDTLVEQTWYEADANKRKETFWKVMRIVNENAYMVYSVAGPEIRVIRKNLHGYIPMSEPGGFGTEKQFLRFWLGKA